MFVLRNLKVHLLGLILTIATTTTVSAQEEGTVLDQLLAVDGAQALVAAVLVVDEAMELEFSIAEALGAEPNLVLLAPTNPAFEALLGLDSGFLDGLTIAEVQAALPSILEGLNLTVSDVINILLLHVGQTEDASSGTLLSSGGITVAGSTEPLPVSLGSKGVRVNYEASVVLPDIVTSNGVIHFIDTVIVDDLLTP